MQPEAGLPMDRRKMLADLRALPMPFAASAVGSAWERRAVDVRAVHAAALERVRELIARVAAHPQVAAAGLIVGQPGSGKTHLLGSLCHAVVPEAGHYAFAEIHPVIDPALPLTHLLREVVGNLLQRPPARPRVTQLESMAARTMAGFVDAMARRVPHLAPRLAPVARGLHAHPEDLLEVVDPRRYAWLADQVTRWLVHTRPTVWEPALRAFLRYPLASHRGHCTAFLRGDELDEPELEAADLGQPDGDAPGSEERAARILRTLGALLEFDRPLVVCFDQVENLDNEPRRRAFAAQVDFLTTSVPGLVALCAVRGDRWPQLAELLPGPTAAAFDASRIDLGGCSAPQARELVCGRLAAAGLPTDSDAPFPFDEPDTRSRLEEILTAGVTPRLVLQRANQLWLDVVAGPSAPPAGESPLDVLARWLDERRAEVLARPERYAPDGPTLAEALRLALVHGAERPGAPAAVLPARAPFDRATLVLLLADARRVGVQVDTHPHHRAIGANLRAAAAWIAGGHAAGAIHLRDARQPLPRRPAWPGTNDERDALVRRGGLVIELPADHAAAWTALVHLEQAIRANDVAYQTDGAATASATMAHLARYLIEREPLPGLAPILNYLKERK